VTAAMVSHRRKPMKLAYLPQIIGIGIVVGVAAFLAMLALKPILPGLEGPSLIGAAGAVAGVVCALWIARKNKR
ncbi:MAG: hypothetical protein ABW184_13510, partial [Sphingobium sp.]